MRISYKGWVGVRFERSPAKIYHYHVKDIRKVVRGDRLVVENDYGSSVVFVVSMGKGSHMMATKSIRDRVAPL